MIKYIKDLLHELRTKDKCFSQCNMNGVCYGKHGGDQYTEYLSYSCVGCPHLTLVFKENTNDKCR